MRIELITGYSIVRPVSRCLVALWLVSPFLFTGPVSQAQDLGIVQEFSSSGTVRGIVPGSITIRHENGERIVYKIQDKDEDAISLDGDRAIFRMPAKIEVAGTLSASLLERGMIVETTVAINRFGKTQGTFSNFKVVQGSADDLMATVESNPVEQEFVPATIRGRILRANERNVLLEVPDESTVTRRGRVEAKFDPESTMEITMDSLNRVRVGDKVKSLKGIKLNNGVYVIREIEVEMTASREAATISFHDHLEQKYSDLSDEPEEPRERRSDHFVLYTDISERQASILLSKLESMYELIGKYYSKRPRGVIECYVVRDLDQWDRSQLHPNGIRKIQERAGVTLTASRGRVTKSVVFSCDKQDVVQHEAVHAFCAMTFGSSGPVWYAEGMAEIGNYWRPGELAVSIDPVVIEYLTSAEPKRLREIVQAGQVTGDSWQAYAWRWALCHMLATNPNYQRRFKRLGVGLMTENGDSFDAAFGPIADQISFEYDQFIQNMGNGYRVDLCTWDWETNSARLSRGGRTKSTIKAMSGWQATGLEVRAEESYDYISQGEWKILEAGDAFSADGKDGEGRLIGVILHEYKLSEPFELGAEGAFVAPVAGQLFLRCEEAWTDLGDNSGELEVHLRITPK